jgi:NADH-quinone oxidoreductase subunit M
MQLHFSWLETTILLPLVGAAWLSRFRHPETARTYCLILAAVTSLSALCTWVDFQTLHIFEAHDRWDLITPLWGDDVLVIDELSAPLLPLATLLFLLTIVVTTPTKVRRFSFTWTLLAESLLLATLSCRHPWVLAGLWTAAVVPVWVELHGRGRSPKMFLLHMGLSSLLLVLGLWGWHGASRPAGWATGLVTVAILIRCGVFPFHCWMTDLFEKATFGTALLYVAPMVGAYAAVRLLLPTAPENVLRGIAVLSLFTAVYTAGMALVQVEARRFFCYLFLSHASLVLVGLETATPVSLTGGLSVWLSVGLALGGFGLTLRCVEARTGRLRMDRFQGLAEPMPILASFFLLTGLASVGFPGTFGFVGMELLMDGTLQAYPYAGLLIVLAAALNGIAILRAYFLIFAGTRHAGTIALRARLSERLTVLGLTLLILGGGLFPQPGIRSRYHAVSELLRLRDDGMSSSTSHDESQTARPPVSGREIVLAKHAEHPAAGRSDR